MPLVVARSRRTGFVGLVMAVALIVGCGIATAGSPPPEPPPARHIGYCMPPIPVIADPVPRAMDTTAAAAAIARAQADADAAQKNAAAQSAYAACMASDTVR